MSEKMRARNLNSVFYADSYHPIQAGSIDGTDVLPHDNAIYRAHLCSSIGLYDPFGDPKIIGDPYCTLFVARLSRLTSEDTLRKVMSKYGRVKNLRLVRDIVTGASRGYAFVEFETEREMRRAYMDAHHSYIDDCEIIVDYNRQQLMPGWIPRRLGGGLSGKKESGQLRFGGREKPFRAPLKPIPYEELKKLGIPPPPEGRYMSRFQVPSPPRRERDLSDREESSHRRSSKDKNRTEDAFKSSADTEEEHYRRSSSHREDEEGDYRRSLSYREDEEGYYRRSSSHREDHARRRRSSERKEEKGSHYHHRSSSQKEHRRRSSESEKHSRKRKERDEHSHRREKYNRHSPYED